MRRLFVAGAVAAVVAVGCGGGAESELTRGPTPSKARAIHLVSAAAGATAAAHSAKVTISMLATTNQDHFTAAGHGVVDFTNERGAFHLDLSMGYRKLSFQVVFAEDVIYQKFPPDFPQRLPKGKHWIGIDLHKLSKKGNLDIDQLLQSTPSIPLRFLDYLKASSGDIEELDIDKVRGALTQHFGTTIDLQKLAARLGEPHVSMTLIELLGQDTFPMEVLIDERGRLRKLSASFDFSIPGVLLTSTQTVEYYDFGTPVTVTLPPQSEVVDFTDLAASSYGAGTGG